MYSYKVHKMKYDDFIKKGTLYFATILVFFERSYAAPHSRKVSQEELNLMFLSCHIRVSTLSKYKRTN